MWELDHKEGWVSKNWCFWTVVLEKTLESPLDCKIKPVNLKPWIFTGRTDAEAEAPILWPPDAKSWLMGKDPDAGKDWRQEEKGMAVDEMVGMASLTRWTWVWVNSGSWWWTRTMAFCSPWGHRQSDMNDLTNNKSPTEGSLLGASPLPP